MDPIVHLSDTDDTLQAAPESLSFGRETLDGEEEVSQSSSREKKINSSMGEGGVVCEDGGGVGTRRRGYRSKCQTAHLTSSVVFFSMLEDVVNIRGHFLFSQTSFASATVTGSG